MKKIISFLAVFGILSFCFMILKNPEICTKSAISGLLICGKVIIPSLFPFTFCVLFILKSGMLEYLKIPETISVFLLSLIGGYPLGAKMLKESYIDENAKTNMLCFCVNAGPAFIILAVGNGIFQSRTVGFLLFLSHILPSIIMAFFFRKNFKTEKRKRALVFNLIDNFTECSAIACSTLISISGYVILFSVITAYINHYAKFLPLLRGFCALLEVTSSITQIRNIYLVSALLGFGGICVWCQVFSLAKNIKINYLKFTLCRIFHALSSAFLTFAFVKFFDISLPVLSNGKVFGFSYFNDNYAVGISLVLMGIVFIISISQKNFAGNMLDDIV